MSKENRFLLECIEGTDGKLRVSAATSRDDQPGQPVELSRRQGVELLSIAATAFSGLGDPNEAA